MVNILCRHKSKSGATVRAYVFRKKSNSLNEMLDIQISNGVITFIPQLRHKTLEERAAEYGGQPNLDGEYDWGKSVRRERG